jgi:hypothetical protein
MTDAAGTAGDRWEFSLLVDRASRILEARGMVEIYLGAKPGKLTGRYLVGYLDEPERLAFLRYMARLLVRGEAEPVIATLRTPSIGIKRFSMAARQGGPHCWWLMFSHAEKHPAHSNASFEHADHAFASAEELATLADAHDHGKDYLDLTVFRAEALRSAASPALQGDDRKVLDDELGESLRDHAYHRIVARPDIGEYALLHGRDTSTSDMAESMAAVAVRHNLDAGHLGLSHETRNLSPSIPAADVIQDARRKLRQNAPSGFKRGPMAQTLGGFNWLPAAITGLCALVILGVWILVKNRG